MTIGLRFTCKVAPALQQCGVVSYDQQKLGQLARDWYSDGLARVVNVPDDIEKMAFSLRVPREGEALQPNERYVLWLMVRKDCCCLSCGPLFPVAQGGVVTGVCAREHSEYFSAINVGAIKTHRCDVVRYPEAHSPPLLGDGVHSDDGSWIGRANYSARVRSDKTKCVVGVYGEEWKPAGADVFKYAFHGDESDPGEDGSANECMISADAAQECVVLAVLLRELRPFTLVLQDTKHKYE